MSIDLPLHVPDLSIADDQPTPGEISRACPEAIRSVPDAVAVPGHLAALGISRLEERAYCALLSHHMATAADMAKELGLSQPSARRLMDRLEAKGLASHSPRTPKAYIAAPPEFTIDSLVKQRQAALEHARLAIPALAKQAERSTRSPGHDHILELITSPAQLRLVVSRISASLRNDIVTFQRAPLLAPNDSPTERPLGTARARTISDASFLETPRGLELLRRDMARGEEPRTVPRLPFKMMIADRSVGLITLVSENPENAPTLLVHRSALLEALYLLFEYIWEKATPILSVDGAHVDTGRADTRLSEATDRLIPLLAAGLNDKNIIHDMKISRATLNRRLAELMKAYGTRTRFQLGWHAAIEAMSAQAGLPAGGESSKPD